MKGNNTHKGFSKSLSLMTAISKEDIYKMSEQQLLNLLSAYLDNDSDIAKMTEPFKATRQKGERYANTQLIKSEQDKFLYEAHNIIKFDNSFKWKQ